MTRIRLRRITSQVQLLAVAPARPVRLPRTAGSKHSRYSPPLCASYGHVQSRCLSSAADGIEPAQSGDGMDELPSPTASPADGAEETSTMLPSPPPSRASHSAKLAALHARLSLSSKIPLGTLARALIDPSADAHPRFNNANLAYVGTALLQYHTSEFLITCYPRLPLSILFAAMKGYVGQPALNQIARAWGVESVAKPGETVDPGLLQYDVRKPTTLMNRMGYVRGESELIRNANWRRGISSRVVYDDAFGEMVPGDPKSYEDADQAEVGEQRNAKDMTVNDIRGNAHANFVRAVIGAIYAHCGRNLASVFVKSHILSRKLDLANLFEFQVPTRHLARLCAREDFDAPVARLESETGRLSRTPVFIVGIYSGRDKLGEGSGPSLDAARTAASINALKSWYLYSPVEKALPSDTFLDDAEPWKPVYVDIGEVIS